jgi:hypothetical protein
LKLSNLNMVSALGQADDVMLATNDLYDLQLLVKLTENYREKYCVKLEPTKTKLIAYWSKNQEVAGEHAEKIHNVTIRGTKVKLSQQLEHVGVIRNTCGNMPYIVDRIAKHKKALGAVLFTGAAKSHRGNPAASLHVHELYCSSVLLSGLATLVLSKLEIGILDQHFTTTIQRLQRLLDKTPHAVVHLLAGSLPFKALLHMRQSTLFSMICHLPTNPLNIHARHVLALSPTSAHSWFLQVRDICKEYCLPHTLELLENPSNRDHFKKTVRLRVLEYWHQQYTADCLSPRLSSVRYLDPYRCSLVSPHPI